MVAVATLFAATAQADPAYDKKLGEYMVHLKTMQTDANRLVGLMKQFDKTSQACLEALEAGKPGKICIVMKKDKMDFEYEHRKFKTYNRIRKVPKFERALQDMMQMEMFSLPKDEANALFKTHMDAKSERQEKLNVMGQKAYDAIEKFTKIVDERLPRIKELKD